MLRRRGGPGLVGTVARTALIAGTATATVGAVSGARNAPQPSTQPQQPPGAADELQKKEVDDIKVQLADLQTQQAQAALSVPSKAAPATGNPDMMTQLQQLAKLKQDGMLTDEEFAAAKARVLTGS
jgi:Short C-terminal domain